MDGLTAGDGRECLGAGLPIHSVLYVPSAVLGWQMQMLYADGWRITETRYLSVPLPRLRDGI